MMTTDPAWTWRLRAEAADSRWQRWWYKVLRWCSDSHAFTNRLASVLGLAFGIWYVVAYVVTVSGATAAMYVVAVVAVLVAVKGLVGQATGLVFHEKALVGGAPTADRFENLVPQNAQKVALVGQNLGSRLDEKYEATLQGIRTLLERSTSGNISAIDEVWLVVQTPLALFGVHPKAARHLRSITLPGLRSLAEDLSDGRVKVAFHPAATLSMLVVDWHRETRLAVVTPKVQTLPIINRRLSVVVSGPEFDTVAPHFDRFLSEARRCEFPGACTATLPHAAKKLDALLDLDVVEAVETYVEQEERNGKNNTQEEAG